MPSLYIANILSPAGRTVNQGYFYLYLLKKFEKVVAFLHEPCYNLKHIVCSIVRYLRRIFHDCSVRYH